MGWDERMIKSLRLQFWIEVVMSAITGILFVVTLIWPHWIEAVFGMSLDNGDGSLERRIVAGLLAVTVALLFMARYEWRLAQCTLRSQRSQ